MSDETRAQGPGPGKRGLSTGADDCMLAAGTDHLAELRRRLDAALRLPPLPCGCRDPLWCLAGRCAPPRPEAQESRFGQPSSYSLSRLELSRHICELRRSGWQPWEIKVRFDYWPAA